MTKSTAGLLVINLGTPRSPHPRDVRPYLREFLFDGRVLDVPAWRRWLILNLFILPFRPRSSGRAYAQIWTDRGSPLLFHGLDLVAKLRARLPQTPIELGMRYGQPSIRAALDRLRQQGAERVVVCPLYPHYSSASTGSSLDSVFRCASALWNVPYLHVVPPFYEHPAFLAACAALARPVLERVQPERVLFSFHGLPERHILKSDETRSHCLRREDCCEHPVDQNRRCYRAQCYATAKLLSARLGIPDDRRIVCFQSRLGRNPWIRPYTDEVVVAQAQRGVRRAVILSPAFVADCLETLEELGMRAAQTFRDHGGDVFELVPSLNANDVWVDALLDILRDGTSWLDDASGRPWAGFRSAADLR